MSPVRPWLAGLAAGLLATSTGCAAAVTLPDPQVDDATRDTCLALLDAVPDTVLGSPPRETTGELGAAWGDPPITLACGVERPAALEATSECYEVNDVGWWPQDAPDGDVFTTLGRDVYIQVGVPSTYGNPSDALAELGPVVDEHTTLLQPCAG